MKSRRERRAQHSDQAKLARDATPQEIFPAGHGPLQSNLAGFMKNAVDVLREHLGDNFDVTLFIAERVPADGENRLPRFNYISTAARADMVAVLRAFADKNEAAGPKLDRINDAPPTGSRQ